MYDFHARNYDPAIGRWLNVDPLAEKFPGVGGYTYCFNNPIMFIDPDGRDPITGIIDAFSSFALDVGMDYIGAILIEKKSPQQAYNDIGWWSAIINATASYGISAITPTGTATAKKMAEIANSKVGKVVIDIVGKMTTKAIDNYSKGNYDTNGEFDYEKIDLPSLFWESAIETLIEKGYGSNADGILETLKKENKILYQKIQKQYNKIENGESNKRIINYSKKVAKQEEKVNKTTMNLIKTKTEEKIITGTLSKEANNTR